MSTVFHESHLSPGRTRPVVLFVEDNLTQLDLYALVLGEDMNVRTATRGETGYAIACREQPDVIVLDVLLPDADGLEVAQRLQTNPETAAIPLLILTGDDEACARAQLVRSDLTGVLMKPCPGARLAAALRSAIARRH